VNPAVSVGL